MVILTVALLMLVSAAFGYIVAERDLQRSGPLDENSHWGRSLRLQRESVERLIKLTALIQHQECGCRKQAGDAAWKRACDDIENGN